MSFDPATYRRWYETPLGRRVDADEKAVLFALADLKPGERVLDIGCGDGAFTETAAIITGCAVGLDRSREMLAAGAARLSHVAGLSWVEGDARELPFADGSFAAVLIVAMLGGIPDPDTVVREARRVLKPGGRLVLADLNRWSSWAAERRLSAWLRPSSVWSKSRFFTRSDIRRLLAANGFGAIVIRGAVYYPPVDSARFLDYVRPLERLGQQANLPGAALLVGLGRR